MSDVLGARLRWEFLHLAVATLETTWVYVWVDALIGDGDPRLHFGWLLLYAITLVTWSRFLLHSDRWEEHKNVASLAFAVAGMLLIVQFAYAPHIGLLSLGDIRDIFLSFLHLVTGNINSLSVAGTALLVLWFRTIHITQEPLTFHFTSYRFRLGVLLVIGGLLVSAVRGTSVSAVTVFLYFGAGLSAIALARAEQVSSSSTAANELPFTPKWAGFLVSALAATLFAGWMLMLGFTNGLIGWLGYVFRPVLWLAEQALYILGLLIFYILFPILNFMLRLLQSTGVGEGMEEEFQLQEPQQPFEQLEQTDVTPPDWLNSPLIEVAGDAIPILIIAGIFLLIAWQLQRNRGRRETLETATREPVSAGSVQFGVGDLLGRGRKRLNALLRRLGPRGWFGTETIEDLYRNLLLWGARRGAPREPDETPYEYLQTLREVAGARAGDVERLTEAYVDSHYGEEPLRRDQLEEMRAAWRRINSDVPRRPAEDTG